MRIKKENFPMLKWLEIDGDNDDKILSILREIRTSIDFEDSFEFKKQWTLLADLFEKWNDVRSNIKDKIYYVSDTFHRNALKSIIMFSKIDFEDFISDNKDNVGLIIHGSGTQLYYDFSDYKNRCIYSFAGRDVNFIYKVFDNESYIVSMDLEAEDFINSLGIEWDSNQLNIREDKLYLYPKELPSLKGLRIMRPGLFLGEMKKNRFEPSQALASALKISEYNNTINLSADNPDTIKYLKCETIDVAGDYKDGWQLICVDGYPLGWGKLTGQTLKNKYLPGWRWM